MSIIPNCRCVMIPAIPNNAPPRSGMLQFGKLQPEAQKQILGPKRFELFKDGVPLDSFLGVKKSDEFGMNYFIQNLSEF